MATVHEALAGEDTDAHVENLCMMKWRDVVRSMMAFVVALTGGRGDVLRSCASPGTAEASACSGRGRVDIIRVDPAFLPTSTR